MGRSGHDLTQIAEVSQKPAPCGRALNRVFRTFPSKTPTSLHPLQRGHQRPQMPRRLAGWPKPMALESHTSAHGMRRRHGAHLQECTPPHSVWQQHLRAKANRSSSDRLNSSSNMSSHLNAKKQGGHRASPTGTSAHSPSSECQRHVVRWGCIAQQPSACMWSNFPSFLRFCWGS